MRLCLFLVALLSWPLIAQEFQVQQYRVANGLPSDVVKAVAQDTLGYFWIATDDGLVKFDGLRFTTYKGALHSQYAKGFLKTRSGRLLHFGDLDLIEIQNKIDTVVFKTIRRGARNPTDTMLWYPKSIFEDRSGNIWIAEPQSVVRIHGNEMMRFDLSNRERSPQFLRSFSFFEDMRGVLHIISYFGSVYRFDDTRNLFELTESKFQPDVTALLKLDNQLWVGCFDGLYSADITPDGRLINISKRVDLSNPTDIKLWNDELVITSAGNWHAVFNRQTNKARLLPTELFNVNMVYVSNEGDLWLASSEALILLQKNLFKKVGSVSSFIESITEDSNKDVYFCTMRFLYRLNEKNLSQPPEMVLDLPRGYFQSLVVNQHGLWAANGVSLLLIKQGRVDRRWTFESGSRFINDLFEDSQHKIWLSQSGINQVNCLNPDLTITQYPIELSAEGSINAVREGPGGIYLLSNGVKTHLYFKANDSTRFVNISLPVDFEYQGDFNVTDLAFNQGILWLSSTEGLLQIKNGRMSRVNLGEQFTRLSVKNLKSLQEGQLLFANSYGLFRYEIKTGDFWLYDESNGLASNTITTRGIFVDDEQHVWVGSSKGLAYSLEPIISHRQTVRPYFIETRVNGSPVRFRDGLQVPYGAFIELQVASITFPEKNILYQYRDRSVDSAWHDIHQNLLAVSGLSAGIHTFEVRARKSGGLAWSDIQTIQVVALKPFWQKAWFILLVFFTGGAIAWASFAIAAALNKKRRAYLQEIINLRTRELQKTNDELTTRNTELDRFVYSASHDMSAPLKSLLGLVYVARRENSDSGMSKYLDMMEQSVKKLEDFIRDITNYSRNARTDVTWKPVNLGQLIQSVLNDHQYTPGYNAIEFKVTTNINGDFISDEMRLKIILNNLISNAIKFHWPGDGRKPTIIISAHETAGYTELKVSDNGRGIPENMKDKVFNMFFRGTDSIPGSGLGLYILKETVLKLGGTVTLESQVDVGSTFIITLPKK